MNYGLKILVVLTFIFASCLKISAQLCDEYLCNESEKRRFGKIGFSTAGPRIYLTFINDSLYHYSKEKVCLYSEELESLSGKYEIIGKKIKLTNANNSRFMTLHIKDSILVERNFFHRNIYRPIEK